MAAVYRYNENTLGCYIHGMHYVGFENGTEDQVKPEPVTLYGNDLQPGDKITGFKSGSNRTSFSLNKDYMTYMGMYNGCLMFDIYEEGEDAYQGNLFEDQKKPVWYLSFAFIGSNAGLLMFSQPGAGYDIQPKTILNYQNETI